MLKSVLICTGTYLLFLCLPSHAQSQELDSILVHFGRNRSDISPKACFAVDAYFRKNRRLFAILKLTLAGYCDNTGSRQYNERLSRERATAVKDYLLRHWPDSTSIDNVEWFGIAYPLNDNRTEAERALNRRVKIIFQKVRPDTTATIPDTTNIPETAIAPRQNSPVVPGAPGPAIYDVLTDTATRAGDRIVLKNVNFIGGRHILLSFSYIILADLLSAMEKNPNLRIRIEGHICCVPDGHDGMDEDTHKDDLSVERAKFIYDYLQLRGINKDRMSYAGLGSSNKLYPLELNPKEQALNRRVEIIILSK